MSTPPQRSRALRAAWLVVVLTGLGAAAAGGFAGPPSPGYDTRFCAAPNPSVPAGADLVGLSTTWGGPSNLTLTLTAAGTIPVPSANYTYSILVGNRSLHGAAIAYVGNSAEATVTYYEPTGDTFVHVPYRVAGSNLTMAFNASELGPAASFSADAEGIYSNSTAAYSFIGSTYNATGSETCAGAGTGPGGGQRPGSSGGSASGVGWVGLVLFAIYGASVGAVLVLAVYLLVVTRAKPPPRSSSAGAPPPPVPPPPVP